MLDAREEVKLYHKVGEEFEDLKASLEFIPISNRRNTLVRIKFSTKDYTVDEAFNLFEDIKLYLKYLGYKDIMAIADDVEIEVEEEV